MQDGVVYTGGTGKIAEHGGQDAQDRHLPLPSGHGRAHALVTRQVETTEIAPTVLHLLGLDLSDLQAGAPQGTPATCHEQVRGTRCRAGRWAG